MPRGVLPRWLARAERFVRHALLAEPAFLDLHREGFFYSSLGNSEEVVNSTFPCPLLCSPRSFSLSLGLGLQGSLINVEGSIHHCVFFRSILGDVSFRDP